MNRRLTDNRGFTLIELLVVILIIGTLATLATPRFLGQRDSANDTKAKAALKNALTIALGHYTERQTFAGYETALTAEGYTFDASDPTVSTATATAASDPKHLYALALPGAGDLGVCNVSRSGYVFCVYFWDKPGDADDGTQYGSGRGSVSDVYMQQGTATDVQWRRDRFGR